MTAKLPSIWTRPERAAAAISARLCSGAGPRAARSGRVQMLGSFAVIANTVLSDVA